MQADIIKRAIDRRDSLRREVDGLQAEIQELDEFIGLYERVSKRLGGSEPPTAIASGIEAALNKPTPQRQLHEMVFQILESEKRALTTSALHDKLVERGAIIGGQNPVGNLGAKLSYAEGLMNIKGTGWWFTPEMQNSLLNQNFERYAQLFNVAATDTVP
jgi:hypothetical protein